MTLEFNENCNCDFYSWKPQIGYEIENEDF